MSNIPLPLADDDDFEAVKRRLVNRFRATPDGLDLETARKALFRYRSASR